MKLFEIINARLCLQQIINEKMSVKTAYKIAKFLKKTDDEAEFFRSHLTEIAKKYDALKEDGSIVPSQENLESYNKDQSELLNTEVENPNIIFSLEEIDSELKFTPSQVLNFMSFIEE